MFIEEPNSKFHFTTEEDIVLPTSMQFVDCTLAPRENNTYMSGSYLIAQYADIINFRRTVTNSTLSDDEIKTKIYDPSKILDDNLITLSKGMESCAINVFSLDASNVIYLNSIEMIKRFLHQYHALIVEMKLSTSISSQNGTFDVSDVGTIISEASGCTKGFLAIGYDDYGIVVQNTLGRKYGSLGFARIKWNVLSSLLVKAVAIKNVLNQ